MCPGRLLANTLIWETVMLFSLLVLDAGCACVVSPVICLKLVDTPGELSRVMGVLAKCGINVVYSYSMISTYIVLSTSEPERAQALLADEPVELISQEDIARIVAERAAKEA